MQNTLRIRRAEKGVSQDRVSRDLGIHINRYFRIEKDYTDPTPEERARLAAYFGVREKVLFPPAQSATSHYST